MSAGSIACQQLELCHFAYHARARPTASKAVKQKKVQILTQSLSFCVSARARPTADVYVVN